MWWAGYGWWWWWIAFLVIFFLLPLGYGWGYRGWGPWYRRRRSHGVPPGTGQAPVEADEDYGWGWGGIFLWIVLLVAIIWLIGAWGWGGTGAVR